MTPYGGRDLGQHCFRWWLVAWRHQAITWTNVDLSSLRSSDVHLRAISLEISQPSVTKISLKIFFLRFYWNLPEANELRLQPRPQCVKTVEVRGHRMSFQHNAMPRMAISQQQTTHNLSDWLVLLRAQIYLLSEVTHWNLTLHSFGWSSAIHMFNIWKSRLAFLRAQIYLLPEVTHWNLTLHSFSGSSAIHMS